MAEFVETGGLKTFRHDSATQSKISDEKKEEIERAYAQANERKQREKKERRFRWTILTLVILLILGGILGYVLTR